MDEMRIRSAFMTRFVSRLITRSVRKKFGRKVPINLQELSIKSTGFGYRLHINADMELTNDDLLLLLGNDEAED